MVIGGALAFGAVLGWWLLGRPLARTDAWLPLCLAAAAGATAYAHRGAAGLAPTGLGLLVGAAAHALWRWSARVATHRAAADRAGAGTEPAVTARPGAATAAGDSAAVRPGARELP